MRLRSAISPVLSLLLAVMYLVTSTTAAAHGLSHPYGTERTAHCSFASDAQSSDAAGDCFFCYHGPALSLFAVTPSLPVPAPAYEELSGAPVFAPSFAPPSLTPPLRAPPVSS